MAAPVQSDVSASSVLSITRQTSAEEQKSEGGKSLFSSIFRKRSLSITSLIWREEPSTKETNATLKRSGTSTDCSASTSVSSIRHPNRSFSLLRRASSTGSDKPIQTVDETKVEERINVGLLNHSKISCVDELDLGSYISKATSDVSDLKRVIEVLRILFQHFDDKLCMCESTVDTVSVECLVFENVDISRDVNDELLSCRVGFHENNLEPTDGPIGVLIKDVEKNESLLNADPARPLAVRLIIENNWIRLLESKRGCKGIETSASQPILFCSAPYTVTTEAASLLSFVVHHYSHVLPTSRRLSRIGIHPRAFLGIGSTSSVCEATYQDQGSVKEGRRVAVKTVSSSHLFDREVRLLRAVKMCEDGLPRLVMSVPSLRTIVTEPVGTPLHRTRISDVHDSTAFISVVKGLKALHCRGVVHRDVSPGNMILICEEGKEKLCLIDLGMAQRRTPGRERSYSGTRSFASDRICRLLLPELADQGTSRNQGEAIVEDGKWTERPLKFEFEDDLESLVKTCVWCLDRDARFMINEEAGKRKLLPGEVLRLWDRVWKATILGQRALQFLESDIRHVSTLTQAMTNDEMSKDVLDQQLLSPPLRFVPSPRSQDDVLTLYERVIDWLEEESVTKESKEED